MATIRSITKVVSSLMLLMELSALESFNVTLSVNTYASLLFDVSLLYPSPVARLKGIGDKWYVNPAGRWITRWFAMEKASEDPRMFWLTSTVTWTCFNFTVHLSRDLIVFTPQLVIVLWNFAVWLGVLDLTNSFFILLPFWRVSRITEAKTFATSSPEEKFYKCL